MNFIWKIINPIFNERTFSTDAKKASLIITILFEVTLIMLFTHLLLILVFAVSAGGFFYALHKLLSDLPETNDE
jgi:hypothetical protein